MKVLVTGAAGQLAVLLARRRAARGDQLTGIDARPLPRGQTFPGDFLQARYTQRRVDEAFRRVRPDVLVHLGRVRTAEVSSFSQRYTQNVLGTRRLLDLARRYEVRRVVVLSTFHVYGAHQHNHLHLTEDDPLRASQLFPELADAVELDHAATNFLWRYRRVETVVLRPVNIVGPTLNNFITRLLRARRCPYFVGYDPMLQFVHEDDVARALELAADAGKFGVFNVAGEGVVSWSHAIRLAGGDPLPVPHVLAYPLVGALARLRLGVPKHLMDYFRYPVVVTDARFREEFGYAPARTTVETLAAVGRSAPPPGQT